MAVMGSVVGGGEEGWERLRGREARLGDEGGL